MVSGIKANTYNKNAFQFSIREKVIFIFISPSRWFETEVKESMTNPQWSSHIFDVIFIYKYNTPKGLKTATIIDNNDIKKTDIIFQRNVIKLPNIAMNFDAPNKKKTNNLVDSLEKYFYKRIFRVNILKTMYRLTSFY